MSELTVINANEYGISSEKEQELLKNLPQIKEERASLETQYNEVIKLDIEDPETAKAAKKLRLLIQKNRTQGINEWHKASKEFFLRGGQFCDAVKRLESQVNERMEFALAEIEEHQERKLAQQLADLQKERAEMLRPYVQNVDIMKLGEMDADVFNAFYSTKKREFEEAEKKRMQEIEDARIAKAKQDLFNERKLILAKYDGISTMELTLETAEQDFINEVENCRIIKEEKEAEADRLRQAQEEKEKLRKKRAAELQPFIMFVSDYEGILIAEPENYTAALSEAKSKKEAHDKEQEHLRIAQEADAARLVKDRLNLREQRLYAIGAHKQTDQYFIDQIRGAATSVNFIQICSNEDFDRLFSRLKGMIEDAEQAAEKKRLDDIAKAERKANRAPDKEKLQKFFDESPSPVFPIMKTEEGKNAVNKIQQALDNYVDVVVSEIDAL